MTPDRLYYICNQGENDDLRKRSSEYLGSNG